ncbi:MAG: hypothetical protein HFH88_11075 [Lachnospiraceae bacterium]|nr:hypothetical protein [Lachnospiraceae bacterium]
MKTEELKSKGLSQEQIDFVMAENGKDLKALQEENKTLTEDRDGWQKKAETAEGSLETVKGQLKDAKETLKGFDGVDVEGFRKKISELEERADKAEKDAAEKIRQRDQRDYLNAEFEKLGISSDRTRKSLMADIMGDDGLKWKDGAFMGLSDYLAKENEKDHFYQTEDEKKAVADKAAEEEAKQKAAGSAPKFTDKSEPKQAPAKDTSPIPVIF